MNLTPTPSVSKVSIKPENKFCTGSWTPRISLIHGDLRHQARVMSETDWTLQIRMAQQQRTSPHRPISVLFWVFIYEPSPLMLLASPGPAAPHELLKRKEKMNTILHSPSYRSVLFSHCLNSSYAFPSDWSTDRSVQDAVSRHVAMVTERGTLVLGNLQAGN